MALSDTIAPILKSLTLPAAIDVRNGGGYGSFTLGAGDEGLGVDYAFVYFDKSWREGSSTKDYIYFFGSSDSFSDGLSSNRLFMDPLTTAGTYTVRSVIVVDKAGNRTPYNGTQLTDMGLSNHFVISSDSQPDTIAPVLTSLMLPTTVDVRNGGGYGSFTLGAGDEGLGVDYAFVYFDKSWREGSSTKDYIYFSGSSDSFSDGLSSNRLFMDPLTTAGTYTVRSAVVVDKAGNRTSYNGTQLNGLGLSHSFVISSDSQLDTVAPVLTSLTVPSSIDVTNGEKSFRLTLGSTDEGLGVDYAFVYFDKSWREGSSIKDYVYLSSDSDSFSDGMSSSQITMSSLSSAGTYTARSVILVDKAGNRMSYSGTQLAGMGLQTSFTIVDRNVAPTATIAAPVTIAEDGGQPLKISLVLTNVAQASGTVTMSFAAGASIVTNGIDVSVPNSVSSYSVSQSPASRYTLELPSIAVTPDALSEGTETIAVTIRASGQVFDTGTDTKTIVVKLVDSGQTGGAGNDVLTGSRFGDDLTGGAGNDTLTGGAGNDRIDGGSGTDTAVFAGLWRQSTLVRDGTGGVTVTGADGIDTLTNVERFAFSDGHFVIDADSNGAQIMRLYDAVLGRAPDPNGLDFYLDMVEDRGGTMAGVAADLVGSGEFMRATGGLDNATFVDYVYQNTLSRAPDDVGKAFYTQRLDSGQSRASFVLEMSESAEHRALTAAMTGVGYFSTDDHYQAVALLYDGFAGRLPDAGGLVFYGDRVKSGQMTLEQVAADFAGSAEFRAAIAGKDSGQIVDFIYQNTLDRAPDAGGRTFYTEQLTRGGSAVGVLLDVALSAEHYNLFSAHIAAGIDFV